LSKTRRPFKKALDILGECPSLEKIVIIDTDGCDMSADIAMSFDDLKDLGRGMEAKEPGLFDRLTDEIMPEDLATIVYTSGTTGPPKGAMVSHSNVFAVMDALNEMKWADDADVLVAFLPLSHVFQRVAGHFFGMYVGIYTYYTESFDTIVEDIQTKNRQCYLPFPESAKKFTQRFLARPRNSRSGSSPYSTGRWALVLRSAN